MIVLHIFCSLLTVSVSMGGHSPEIYPLPTGLPSANLTASPTIVPVASSVDCRPMAFAVFYDPSVERLGEYKNVLEDVITGVLDFYSQLLSIRTNGGFVMFNPCGLQMNESQWNQDFILVVSLASQSECDGMEAGSSICSLLPDENGFRTGAGKLSICGEKFVKRRFDRAGSWFDLIRHEMAHLLGFSETMFEYYRDKNGEYHTKKNPKPMWNSYTVKKDGELPNVVRNVTRQWKVPTGIRPHTVWMLTTPAVVREVRDHFNCPDLEGVELENLDYPGTQFNHLEGRLFQSDTMSGVRTNYTKSMSRVTLAVFEDMGWYQVNYDLAEPMEWGNGKGCDFAKNSCYEWMNTHEEDPFPFCNQRQHKVCSSSRREVLTCYLYDSNPEKPEYKYFESLPFMGYGMDFIDYCPFYSITTAAMLGEDGDAFCTNPYGIDVTQTNQIFGSDSRCFSVESSTPRYPTAGCFQTKCDTGAKTYNIRTMATEFIPCPEGDIVSFDKPRTFTIKCPSYDEICSLKRIKKRQEMNPNMSTFSTNHTTIFSVLLVLSMF